MTQPATTAHASNLGRRLVWLAVLLVLVGVVAVAVIPGPRGAALSLVVKPALLAQLEDRTELSASMGSLKFIDKGISLTDLRLEAQAPGSAPRFQARRVDLEIPTRALLRGDWHKARSLTLIEPRFTKSHPTSPAPSPLASLRGLDRLIVRDGSFETAGHVGHSVTAELERGSNVHLEALVQAKPRTTDSEGWTKLTLSGELDSELNLRGSAELEGQAESERASARAEELVIDLDAALQARLDLSARLFLGLTPSAPDLKLRAEISRDGLRIAATGKDQELARLEPLLAGQPVPDVFRQLGGRADFDLFLQADGAPATGFDFAGGRASLNLELGQTSLGGEAIGRVDAALRLANHRLELERIEIEGPAGTASVRGLQFQFESDDVLPRAGSIALHTTRLIKLLAQQFELPFGPLGLLEQLDLDVHFDPRRAELQQLQASGPFGSIAFDPSLIDFVDGMGLDLKGRGSADLEFLGRWVNSVGARLGKPGQLAAELSFDELAVKTVAFDAVLDGSLSDPHLGLEVRSLATRAADAPLSTSARASVRLARRDVEIRELSIERGAERLLLRGTLSAHPPAQIQPGPTVATAWFPAASEWRLKQLTGEAHWEQPIAGYPNLASGSIDVQLEGGPNPALAAHGELDLFEIGRLEFETSADSKLMQVGFETCEGSQVRARVDPSDLLNRLIAAPIDPGRGFELGIAHVAVAVPGGQEVLSSTEQGIIQWNADGTWTLGQIPFEGVLGRGVAEFGGAASPWLLWEPSSAWVHAEAVDLAVARELFPEFSDLKLRGTIDHAIWIRPGSPGVPGNRPETLVVEASGLDAMGAGLNGTLVAHGVASDGPLQLKDLEWREPRSGTLSLAFAPDSNAWQGDLNLALDESLTAGWLESNEEHWRRLAPSLVGANLRAGLRIDGSLTMEDCVLDMPGRGLHAKLNGAIDLPRRPNSLGEDWDAIPIRLNAEGQLDDLSLLANWLPDVRSASGRARFGDLNLNGSLGSPEGSGTVEIEDASIKFEGSLPALDQLNLSAALTDRRLSISQLSGQLASAPIQASGTMTFQPDGDPLLQVVFEGQDVLLARSRDLRLRGDVDLLLSGALSEPRLEGSIQLQRSRYARSLPVLSLGFEALRRPFSSPVGQRGFVPFSVRNAPFENVRFDVQVTAAEPLRLENNLFKGGLIPDLKLGGTARQPELVGRVFLEPGLVALPAAKLRIAGGTVSFPASDPFVPRLDVYGESRVRGHDLAVSITGPYDDPSVRVSSVPPLPPGDALVLLTTGVLTEQALSEEGSAQTARLLAVYLVQDLGASLFGSSEGESLLDRLEIVKGEEIASDGTETFEASWRLDQNTLLEGDQLRLVGEYDRFQQVNFGLRFLWRFR